MKYLVGALPMQNYSERQRVPTGYLPHGFWVRRACISGIIFTVGK